MDARALGRRIAQVRDANDMSQSDLGRSVGLALDEIDQLERGERPVDAKELWSVAAALKRPVAFFITNTATAVISRRNEARHHHADHRFLDIELEGFASDVQKLLKMGLLTPPNALPQVSMPRDHSQAEVAAMAVRKHLNVGSGPLGDLVDLYQGLGLQTLIAPLGSEGPDGASTEVGDPQSRLGVTVINGQASTYRRRSTLTHELGHWLFEDAYNTQWSEQDEKFINSFAFYLLAPRDGVTNLWNSVDDLSDRDRALTVSGTFLTSWQATLQLLKHVNLIDQAKYAQLQKDPLRAEYLRLGFTAVDRSRDEIASYVVSSKFSAACVNGYESARLTKNRVIDLLRGALSERDLTDQEPPIERWLRIAHSDL